MEQTDETRSATYELPPIIPVTRYSEVREAFMCPHLSAAVGGPGEELFHKDTVLRLDGRRHLARRRALSELLKHGGHHRFRDRYLFPTATAALAQVLDNPGTDGIPRTDIVSWGRRVNYQLSAMLIGYDEATTPEGADALYELMETARTARPGARQVVMGDFDPDTDEVRRGLEARRTLYERFYEPAIARRRRLVAEVQGGERNADELPHDLLTIVARGINEDYDDPEIAEREAVFLATAAVDTTTSTLVWTLHELFQWYERHPEDRERVDDEFYVAAVSESLRLHPATPGHPRAAVRDVELEGGTEVPEGSIAMILPHEANVDPEIWGDDAHDYDPHRSVPPGVKRHGFAFGAGPHICFGQPLAMGNEGLDGSLVFFLRLLLAAGVAPDPDRPSGLPPGNETHGAWADRPQIYPVTFAPVAGRE